MNGAGGVWQRDIFNNVVTVSVFSKFLILSVLKFSTLDPLGMGVEYEGGKPGISLSPHDLVQDSL